MKNSFIGLTKTYSKWDFTAPLPIGIKKPGEKKKNENHEKKLPELHFRFSYGDYNMLHSRDIRLRKLLGNFCFDERVKVAIIQVKVKLQASYGNVIYVSC